MRRNLLFNETSSNDYLTMEALEDDMTVSFSTNTIQYSIDGNSNGTNLSPGSSTPVINTGQKISFKAVGLTPTSSAGIGTFTVSKKYNLLGSVMSMNAGIMKIPIEGSTNDYEVNLNNQWRVSSKNPDSSLYDVYESYSNYNVHSGIATMSITITGYTTFKVYIRSYAESNYDYVMISQLDQTINGSTSYSSSSVKAHTSGNQQSGTALSAYTLVEYTNIDGGTHTITVNYKKDYSGHYGDDRGYILIPKDQGVKYEIVEVASNDEILNAYQFFKLFYNNTTLQSVSKDFLPATVLKDHCYDQMFSTCTSLTNVPNLPAMELADYCYYCMYITCSSLKSVPDNYLPATVMKSNCYAGLFNATGLTKAPALPATTMAPRCYGALFYDCKSLTEAPTLPAITLASECYLQMFYRCSALNYIKMLATDISASGCLSNGVYGVAATGTFIQSNNATGSVLGVNGIPQGGTVQLPDEFSMMVPKGAALAGDILCANSSGTKIVVSKDRGSEIPSGYEAIGVVVIPPGHNVYGTGKGAAVSLKCMDPNNPDNGSLTITSVQGGDDGTNDSSDHTGRPKYSFINCHSSNNSSVVTARLTRDYGCHFASDFLSKYQNPVDTNTYGTKEKVTFYDGPLGLPSPYLSNGSRNTDYYTNEFLPTEPSEYFLNNALSDFSGAENTNALVSRSTTYSGRTSSTIPKVGEYTHNHHPAACCTGRYHTVGTNQGDWYIPSMGEFGYLAARGKVISNTMNLLGSPFGERLLGGTSTEYDEGYAYAGEVGDSYGFSRTYNNYGYVVGGFIHF